MSKCFFGIEQGCDECRMCGNPEPAAAAGKNALPVAGIEAESEESEHGKESAETV